MSAFWVSADHQACLSLTVTGQFMFSTTKHSNAAAEIANNAASSLFCISAHLTCVAIRPLFAFQSGNCNSKYWRKIKKKTIKEKQTNKKLTQRVAQVAAAQQRQQHQQRQGGGCSPGAQHRIRGGGGAAQLPPLRVGELRPWRRKVNTEKRRLQCEQGRQSEVAAAEEGASLEPAGRRLNCILCTSSNNIVLH